MKSEIYVAFPFEFTGYILGWSTDYDRGHLILARSRETLVKTWKTTVKKFRGAKPDVIYQGSFVAPPEDLKENLAKLQEQQRLHMCVSWFECMLRTLLEADEKLPKGMSKCMRVDKEYGGHPYGCSKSRCIGGVVFSAKWGKNKDAIMKKIASKYMAEFLADKDWSKSSADDGPPDFCTYDYHTSARNQFKGQLSRAPQAKTSKNLLYAKISPGDHSSGTTIDAVDSRYWSSPGAGFFMVGDVIMPKDDCKLWDDIIAPFEAEKKAEEDERKAEEDRRQVERAQRDAEGLARAKKVLYRE